MFAFFTNELNSFNGLQTYQLYPEKWPESAILCVARLLIPLLYGNTPKSDMPCLALSDIRQKIKCVVSIKKNSMILVRSQHQLPSMAEKYFCTTSEQLPYAFNKSEWSPVRWIKNLVMLNWKYNEVWWSVFSWNSHINVRIAFQQLCCRIYEQFQIYLYNFCTGLCISRFQALPPSPKATPENLTKIYAWG